MSVTSARIVSLIPSATEIVAALGLTSALVGRSHACDMPPQIQSLPACTQPRFDPAGSSRQIHDRVTQLLTSALSVYQVETPILQALQPTHILTQAQCEVCAASLQEVEAAVATRLDPAPQILSLQPQTLEDLWSDIRRVAQVFDQDPQPLLSQLQGRVQACQDRVSSLSPSQRPRVACIEWTDPVMAAGNWVPQLVELAGGRDVLGRAGQTSHWLNWSDLLQADPEVILVLPCGFDLCQSQAALSQLSQTPGWQTLRAVQDQQVYCIDGNQYFNRPGPRLVDSLEILAEILHPDRVSYGYQHQGWQGWTASELPYVPSSK